MIPLQEKGKKKRKKKGKRKKEGEKEKKIEPNWTGSKKKRKGDGILQLKEEDPGPSRRKGGERLERDCGILERGKMPFPSSADQTAMSLG